MSEELESHMTYVGNVDECGAQTYPERLKAMVKLTAKKGKNWYTDLVDVWSELKNKKRRPTLALAVPAIGLD